MTRSWCSCAATRILFPVSCFIKAYILGSREMRVFINYDSFFLALEAFWVESERILHIRRATIKLLLLNQNFKLVNIPSLEIFNSFRWRKIRAPFKTLISISKNKTLQTKLYWLITKNHEQKKPIDLKLPPPPTSSPIMCSCYLTYWGRSAPCNTGMSTVCPWKQDYGSPPGS